MLSRSLADLILDQTKSRWNCGILTVPFSMQWSMSSNERLCGSGWFIWQSRQRLWSAVYPAGEKGVASLSCGRHPRHGRCASQVEHGEDWCWGSRWRWVNRRHTGARAPWQPYLHERPLTVAASLPFVGERHPDRGRTSGPPRERRARDAVRRGVLGAENRRAAGCGIDIASTRPTAVGDFSAGTRVKRLSAACSHPL